MRAIVRVAALLGSAALLASCQAAKPSAHAPSATPDPTGSGASQAAPQQHGPVSVAVVGQPADKVSWRRPVSLAATNAPIVAAVVTGADQRLSGRVSADGRRWRSTGQLLPDAAYTATLRLTVAGHTLTRHVKFSTRPAPVLTMSATPGPGAVVGVGEPVAVTFNRSVLDRATVQRRMSVTSNGSRVNGRWHWFSDTVVHFRPRHYWPADTRFTVHVDLAHTYAGAGVWGDRNHVWTWSTGDAHITHVNARRHTFTVTVNGKRFARWPTGTGMPGFDTRRGTYIVLDKLPKTEMTSCSVGESCSPGSPDYYDLMVYWDTRLTDSGTFVHAAPWDSELGAANTSHGCIHLSTQDAQTFYNMSRPGDVVTLTGSTRPPNPVDTGMMDWNMSWAAWVAGSALHH